MPNQSANEDGIIIRADSSASALNPVIVANLLSVFEVCPSDFHPNCDMTIGADSRAIYRVFTMWTRGFGIIQSPLALPTVNGSATAAHTHTIATGNTAA